MNSPASDIATYLDAQSALGLTAGTDLFYSHMPDGTDVPDLCVCVYDSGGESPEDFDYWRPTFQVLVRGARSGYAAAYETIRAIAQTLHTADFSATGARYIGIWQMGGIHSIGQDSSGRPRLTVNFRSHRTAT